MITIATLLWDQNRHSLPFSRHYTDTDVVRLYRGFARHLTVPFRFVCFTDRLRAFRDPIEQEPIGEPEPNYSACIEPYRLNAPMILVGLDTIVTGDCDPLAAYCRTADRPAVPRDPFYPNTVCNGVALVPAGCAWVREQFKGGNDMEWIRELWRAGKFNVIDDIMPGLIASYKGKVRRAGLDDERIVYFHGEHKPHQLGHVGWIDRHWAQNVTEAA